MDASDLRVLIADAVGAAQDADSTSGVTPSRLYTPQRHKSALLKDATVVVGARGVGKTIWYLSLQDDALRRVASQRYRIPELDRYVVHRGFGNHSVDDYPSSRVLARLVNEYPNTEDQEEIWTAVVLRGLGWRPMLDAPTWSDRLAIVLREPEAYEAFLKQVDQEASARDASHLFMFDGLDRLAPRRADADRLASTILRFALRLRLSYRCLRAKVFIRPDMYASADRSFPDASKLDANRADLRWETNDLYGMFFQRLGNSDFADESSDFRAETGQWVQRDGYFAVPTELMSDSDEQKRVFSWLAGNYMGANHRRGYTFTWLPNHLADGLGQTSPRSFMAALKKAAEISSARFAGHSSAIHWDALREGVREASEVRAKEIDEDIPWVQRVLRPLAGMQVPMDKSDILDRWLSDGTVEGLFADDAGVDEEQATGPSAATPPGIFDDLVGLGILTERVNGKIDMPDVYRIAFELGRRGGVPRYARH